LLRPGKTQAYPIYFFVAMDPPPIKGVHVFVPPEVGGCWVWEKRIRGKEPDKGKKVLEVFFFFCVVEELKMLAIGKKGETGDLFWYKVFLKGSRTQILFLFSKKIWFTKKQKKEDSKTKTF